MAAVHLQLVQLTLSLHLITLFPFIAETENDAKRNVFSIVDC